MEGHLLLHRGYLGKAYYCKEDDRYYGQAVLIKDCINCSGDNLGDVKDSFKVVVNDYIELCTELNKTPCTPPLGPIFDSSLNARFAKSAQEMALVN